MGRGAFLARSAGRVGPGPRRAGFAAVLALGVALCPGPTALAGQGRGDQARGAAGPEGIYVATLPLINGRRSPDEAVYRVKGADGVYVRLVWRTIEPAPGAYDWATLDTELDRALRSGKKISLSVITGGFQPDWLADRGVSKSTFVVGRGGARRACVTIRLGWPWDPDYQAAYVSMMTALSRHLRSRPGAYEAVRIVKLTGIGQNTEELRLPASDGRAGWRGREDPCDQSDAIRTWREAGYRPGPVVDAWNRMAAGVHEAFPDKLLAQDILQANDFPPIDDKGEFSREAAAAVKDRIIRDGIARFGSRFAVQWNGLTARGRLAPAVLRAREAGATVGWQSNAFNGLDGAGCNAERSADPLPCDLDGFRAILDRGKAAGASYLEIWAPDALRFPGALSDGAAPAPSPGPR